MSTQAEPSPDVAASAEPLPPPLPPADASFAGERPRSDDSGGRGFLADSLALGMALMFAMTVVQRGVGFVRGVWFCRLLDDADLGRWALAFGFISLITPVMLLGIPGCLPRFAEHYRRRGQLRGFVGRIGLATSVCGLSAILAMTLAPGVFGWAIFLEPSRWPLVRAVAGAVASVMVFNFVLDLNAALRQIRVVSCMQFAQGVGFTAVSLLWLLHGGGLAGVILAFALASTLGTLIGGWSLWRGWEVDGTDGGRFDGRALWRRMLPYAAALWMMNLLGNAFDLSDRWMILHFTPGDEGSAGDVAGQAAVGQYHSGRVFPELLLSLATMVSGVLLPYLAADWESGRSERVRERLRLALVAASFGCTLLGVAVLGGSSWLFGTLLQGRYSAGLAVLPATFVFCSWAALATLAQTYLWVRERGQAVAVTLAVGLAVNFALNAALIPVWGLAGAVTATTVAHGVVLCGIGMAIRSADFPLGLPLIAAAALPVTLLGGPVAAAIGLTVGGGAALTIARSGSTARSPARSESSRDETASLRAGNPGDERP